MIKNKVSTKEKKVIYDVNGMKSEEDYKIYNYKNLYFENGIRKKEDIIIFLKNALNTNNKFFTKELENIEIDKIKENDIKLIKEYEGEVIDLNKTQNLINDYSRIVNTYYYRKIKKKSKTNIPKYKENEKVIFGNRKNVIVKQILNEDVYLLEMDETLKRRYEGDTTIKKFMIVDFNSLMKMESINSQTKFANDELNKKLRYTNTSLDSIIGNYYFSGIDMNPEYQRELVWNLKDKEYLIESIFNNNDIGRFLLIKKEYQNNDSSYEILDGKQRLTTIIEYIENEFKYKGKYFSELSFMDRTKFKNKDIIIGYSDELKLEEKLKLFLATNKSGKPISEKHLNNIEEKLNRIMKIQENNMEM